MNAHLKPGRPTRFFNLSIPSSDTTSARPIRRAAEPAESGPTLRTNQPLRFGPGASLVQVQFQGNGGAARPRSDSRFDAMPRSPRCRRGVPANRNARARAASFADAPHNLADANKSLYPAANSILGAAAGSPEVRRGKSCKGEQGSEIVAYSCGGHGLCDSCCRSSLATLVWARVARVDTEL